MNKEPDVRWPAEWEPQDAVWLSWPHRRDLWQGGLDELQQTYGSVAAAIAPHALVCMPQLPFIPASGRRCWPPE